MTIEDRVREAMRERAGRVRSASDRWSEVEQGPMAPASKPSGHRAIAAAVAFALFAAAAFLVWSALRPTDRVTPADTGGTYILQEVRVDGPHVDPQTDGVVEGSVDVGYRVTWSGDVFPGVHRCSWTVFDRGGTEVGRATGEVLALSPSNQRQTTTVEVTGKAATASGTCGDERLDVVAPLVVTDAKVLSTLGSRATIQWDAQPSSTPAEDAWLTPYACTATVVTGAGDVLARMGFNVAPGPSMPSSFETDVPLGTAAADLTQAERETLDATVACEPFTGQEPSTVEPSPADDGNVGGIARCGGEPVTLFLEAGMTVVVGTPGNDRVILPEGAEFIPNGGVDLLCAADGSIEDTVVPEGITVAVYNASDEPGLAAALADQLNSQGFEIGDVGDGPRVAGESSVIYFRTAEARPVAEYVASLMTNVVVEGAPPDLPVSDRDAEVVVLVASA
jgi:hypothetical protein